MMDLKWLKSWQDKFLRRGLFAILFFPIFVHAQFQSAKDCSTAYRICDATASYFFEANTDSGSVNDSYLVQVGSLFEPRIYCVSGYIYPTPEWHPAWFVFTAQYSGEFGFLICPENPTADWQWALFENPVCGNLNDTSHQLRCDTGSPVVVVNGCTGIGFKNGFGGGANGLQAYVNITAGNTYVLYCSILDWQLTAPQRATLTFQGAAVTAHPDIFNYPGCTMSAADFTKEEVAIYPNPFTTTLQIESNSTFKTMELYDVLGKQIFNQNFENKINTSKLTQGVYLLRLITEEGVVVVKKVVKE